MTAIATRLNRLVRGATLPIALASMIVGCAPGAKSPDGGELAHEGAPAPAFDAEFVTGQGPKTLADAKGKVVLVDFWGTFCEPCKKSFPKYQELADQFNGELAIIAISVDEPEDKGKIAEFVKATGVKFPVVWDKDHGAARRYDPKTMPTSFIIDKSGVVRHVHMGYHADDEAKVADEVRALLK
jgi:alkyl hydroperoxide reductase subunit AhpC